MNKEYSAISQSKVSNLAEESSIYSFLFSALVAATVAFGEALVSVTFMGATGGIGPLLLIAIPVFLVNFFLFRIDTRNFLQSIGNNELFKDNHKQDFTGWKKHVLRFAMLISVMSGLLCGFLQLNSILTSLGMVFFGLSASASVLAPPIGLVVLAVGVASLSALANAALLYANVERFIRDGQYLKYKQVYQQIFYNEPDPKTGKPISLFWKLFHGLFLVAGLIAAVIVYCVSLGMYQQQAFTTFRFFCHLPAKTSLILMHLVANPGHLPNGFFYALNVKKASEFIEWLFKNGLEIIKRCINSTSLFYNEAIEDVLGLQPKDKLSFEQVGLNFILLPISMVVFTGLVYFCVINAISQSKGVMDEPRSLAWLTMFGASHELAQKIAGILIGISSGYANMSACCQEVLPDRQDVDDVVEYSSQKVQQVVSYLRGVEVVKQKQVDISEEFATPHNSPGNSIQTPRGC